MSVELLLGTKSPVAKSVVATLSESAAKIAASRALADKSNTALALSVEAFTDEKSTSLTNTYNAMEAQIRTMAKEMGLSLEDYQVTSATIGGLMAADPQTALASKMRPVSGNTVLLHSGATGSTMERLAIEAYDERENRNAQMHSIVYNLLSSRMDDFAETLFPTIVASPNEVGVTVALKFFYVYNDFKRNASGALAEYNRKNVMRAAKDMTILKNDLTRAIPVLRQGGEDKNTDKFVDLAIAPSWSADLGVGVSVETAWLKVDTKIDLLGISQTNELLSSGIMGPTDSLDTYLKLTAVLVSVGDGTNTDVFAIELGTDPSAVMTYAPTGNYRKMMLAMDSNSIVLSDKTTKLNGTPLAVLDELATHKARVQLNINGNVVLDKGDTIINRGTLQLTTLRNAAGNLVTGSVFDTLADKLANAQVIGYKLDAWRANSNVRQRGQLMDTQLEYRVIPVPFRSPIGVLAPAGRAATDDTQPLQTLVATTGRRMTNEAIGVLQKWEKEMDEYQAVTDASGTVPEMSAIGSAYVIPTFMREAANLPLTVDSLKSHERFKDIRGALVEKIRFLANELQRRSEYQAVAAYLTNNPNFKPTVIVATDPVIHNYLSMDGDLRMLGDSFEVKVVSTIAQPIENKIYVTFGVFDQQRNTTINPLNSGNTLYTPELVLNLPISRDGQHSNELTVTPRFTQFYNLPVLGVINVSGLPAVTNKQAVHTHEVV